MAEATPRCTCPPNGALVFLGHLKTCPEVLVAEVRVTRYEVCAVPRSNVNARHFAIRVEEVRDGLWIATDGYHCLNSSGEWVEDPSGIHHRYSDEQMLLRLAVAAAPHVTVNGFTVADALAQKETPDA